LSFYLMYFIY